MSKILFNTLVDLSSAATPSNGFLIAYDIDGVLKQKDQYGVITAVGATGISASIPSLSQVLAVNNSTANYDIIMGTGTSIRSNDGNGQIDLDYDGTESHVYISSDSGALLEGVLEVSNHYSGLAAKNYFMGVESYDLLGERVTNIWSTYTSSIVNIGVSKDYYSTYQQYQDIAIHENSTYVSVSDYNRHAVFIGTRNSGFDAGITNSVIIGGYSMSATQSNTVYLGNNVNINNAYTLPNTDGVSNQVLKTDGAGNVTWQNDSGSSTPTLSQVLLAGNTSSSNIILNTGHSIVSSDVSSQTKIQIMGGTATSFFMIDNDTSLLNKAWIVGDFNSFQSGYNDNYLDAMDTYISLHSVTGSVIAKVTANSLNNRVSIGIADSSATFSNTQDSIEVFNTRTASITTGNTDKWSTVISSRNSSVNTGIRNSVILGGSGITASNHNTVYLGNIVNINNKYTLPSVDGTSGQVLKTDGAGNITWSSDATGSLESVLSNGNTTGTYSINVENYITFEGQGSTTSITGVAMGSPLSGFQYNVTGDLTSEIYTGSKIRVVNTQGGVNDGSFTITNATFSGGNTYFQWSGIVTNFVPPYGDIITGIESSYLQVNFASASNLYILPNKSGTIALLDDITPSTPSLSQVLAVGNSTIGYDIIIGTGNSIISGSGTSQFNLDYGTVNISTNNGTGSYITLSEGTSSQSIFFWTDNTLNNGTIKMDDVDGLMIDMNGAYIQIDHIGGPIGSSIYINTGDQIQTDSSEWLTNLVGNMTINVGQDYTLNSTNNVYIGSSDATIQIITTGVTGSDITLQASTGNYTVINDGLKILDGNEGAGKVLTSDVDGVATWQTFGIIYSTYGDAQTLISNSELMIGYTYIISDRADLGIMLVANSNNTFSLEGKGIFLNPDFQSVGDYSGVSGYNTTNGVWNSGSEGGYVNGDVVFWDGYHYVVVDDGSFDGSNPSINTTSYTLLTKDITNGYIKEVDFIIYDFNNDSIIKRIDKRNNEWNPSYVTGFQPGNDVVYNNIIYPTADVNIINQRGTFNGNTIMGSGDSYVEMLEDFTGSFVNNIASSEIFVFGNTSIQKCFIESNNQITFDPGLNIIDKRIDKLGSTFEAELDMTDGTDYDLLSETLTIPTSLNYVGIFTLINTGQTITKINLGDKQTKHRLRFYTSSGYTQIFNHTPVSSMVPNCLLSDAALPTSIQGYTSGPLSISEFIEYENQGGVLLRYNAVTLS